MPSCLRLPTAASRASATAPMKHESEDTSVLAAESMSRIGLCLDSCCLLTVVRSPQKHESFACLPRGPTCNARRFSSSDIARSVNNDSPVQPDWTGSFLARDYHQLNRQRAQEKLADRVSERCKLDGVVVHFVANMVSSRNSSSVY